MEHINYSVKAFDELSGAEVYQIGQLRQQVFIIEQDCNYLDFDGRDLHALHLLAKNDKNELVGYCRLLPQNVVYPNENSIGRVVNSKAVRGQGIGRKMMEIAIKTCHEQLGKITIRISAQDYLVKFYQSLGFIATDTRYLEDNLPHTEMYLPY